MIEQLDKTDVVTCISCRHVYVSLADRLTGRQQYARCTRTKKTKTDIDVVTGKTLTSTEMHYCGTERGLYSGRDECGVEGRFWEPKHTRDVFTLLKRS
jgi:hypothetical protein